MPAVGSSFWQHAQIRVRANKWANIVNYFPFHIGDYASHTAHLSWLEDCAYRRLIDLYYSRELPIPVDQSKAFRLVRANSKDEKEAVKVVLDEFFKLTDSGWIHERCDAEIKKAQVSITRSKINGMKGGRKPKQNPEETQQVISRLPKQNPEETQDDPKENLDTKPPNPIPKPNIPLTPETGDERDPALPENPENQNPPAQPSMATAACVAMRSVGMASVNPSDPRILALVKADGVSIDTFAEAAKEAMERGKGFAYALSIVENQLIGAQRLAEKIAAQRSSTMSDILAGAI